MIIITNNKRCNCFEKHIANSCMWMRTTDVKKPILLMPYFLNNKEVMIRFNFCPICGQEVRDIEAERE
jgi:uncharacterized protein with PIN domain